MGNSFIGFPVPRAKIADMIATDAPPTLHSENHEAGGKDEIDCTGLVGAGGISLSPLSIPPPAFVPEHDTYDWSIEDNHLYNRATLAAQSFWAPVYLPHGAVVTKLKLYGQRDASNGSLGLYLKRIDTDWNDVFMAAIAADWTNGTGSKEDTSIDYATIDNGLYAYALLLGINPNDSIYNVGFLRGEITFE